MPDQDEISKFLAQDSQSLVEQHAKKYGVDPEFAKRILKQESGLRADVLTGGRKSSAGATGPMQLMPATARGLGVDHNDYEQNIEGGVKYLAQLHKQFGGDQTKIAAAYNAGPGAVQKYGGVPPYRETQNYVQKVAQPGGGASDIEDFLRQPESQPAPQPEAAPLRPVRRDQVPGPQKTTARGPVLPKDSNPFAINQGATGFEQQAQQANARTGQISPEVQAEADRRGRELTRFNQRSTAGKVAEVVAQGGMRGMEGLAKAGKMAGAIMSPGAPGAVMSQITQGNPGLLTNAAEKNLQGQEAAANVAMPNTAPVVRGTASALTQLPAAVLAGAGGTVPAMAGNALLQAGQEDWRDPKHAAIRTALGATLPIAGGHAAQAILRPASVAGRLASGAVGGAAGNVLPAAAEQVMQGRIDPQELAQQAVIGAGMGAALPPSAYERARPVLAERPGPLTRMNTSVVDEGAPVQGGYRPLRSQGDYAPIRPDRPQETQITKVPTGEEYARAAKPAEPQAAPGQPEAPAQSALPQERLAGIRVLGEAERVPMRDRARAKSIVYSDENGVPQNVRVLLPEGMSLGDAKRVLRDARKYQAQQSAEAAPAQPEATPATPENPRNRAISRGHEIEQQARAEADAAIQEGRHDDARAALKRRLAALQDTRANIKRDTPGAVALRAQLGEQIFRTQEELRGLKTPAQRPVRPAPEVRPPGNEPTRDLTTPFPQAARVEPTTPLAQAEAPARKTADLPAREQVQPQTQEAAQAPVVPATPTPAAQRPATSANARRRYGRGMDEAVTVHFENQADALRFDASKRGRHAAIGPEADQVAREFGIDRREAAGAIYDWRRTVEAAAKSAKPGTDVPGPSFAEFVRARQQSAAQVPEARTPQPPTTDAPAQVQFTITRDMRQQLADLGYSRDDVNAMKPDRAAEIIKSGETKARAPQPPTGPLTEPTNRLQGAEYAGGELPRTAGLRPEGQPVEMPSRAVDPIDTAPEAKPYEVSDQMARRRQEREAALKGPFGKFAEQARKFVGREHTLASHPEMRQLLDLPEMPDYKNKRAWTEATHDTMNALAALVNKPRSSEMSMADIYEAVHRAREIKARKEGKPVFDQEDNAIAFSPDLEKTIEDTITRYAISTDNYQNFIVDGRVDNILRRLDQQHERPLSKREASELQKSLISIADEHKLSKNYAENLWKYAQADAASRAQSRSSRATPGDLRAGDARGSASENQAAPEAERATGTYGRERDTGRGVSAEAPAPESAPLSNYKRFENANKKAIDTLRSVKPEEAATPAGQRRVDALISRLRKSADQMGVDQKHVDAVVTEAQNAQMEAARAADAEARPSEAMPAPRAGSQAGEIPSDLRGRDKHVQMTRDEFANRFAEATTPKPSKSNKAAIARYESQLEIQRDQARRVHETSVKYAINEGKPVPPEVLADYPDLQAKSAPPVAEMRPRAESEAKAALMATEGKAPAKPARKPRVAQDAAKPAGKIDGKDVTADEMAVYDALAKVEPRLNQGAAASFTRARAEAGLSKEAFDKAAANLADKEILSPHYHDFPQSLSPAERAGLVQAGGSDYVGAALRKPGATVERAAQPAGRKPRVKGSVGKLPNETEGGTTLGGGLGALQGLGKLFRRDTAPPKGAELDAWMDQVSRSLPKDMPDAAMDRLDQAVFRAADAAEAGDAKAWNQHKQEVQKILAEHVSIWEKASTLRKAGMLSRPTTHLRNILGNTVFQALEETARVPGAATDLAISALTGRRAYLGPSRGAMADAINAAATRGYAEAKRIMKTGSSAESQEQMQTPKVTFKNPILNKATDFIFRSLDAEDRIFFTYAQERAMKEIAKVAALNEAKAGKIKPRDVKARAEELSSNPTEEMEADALTAANIAVFRNDNKISDAIKGARNAIGKKGNFALDLVLPFDRTPTNIVLRALDYTPLGLVKAGAKATASTVRGVAGGVKNRNVDNQGLGRAVKQAMDKAFTPQQQRAISESVGRGTIGSGLIAMGYALAAKGIMTGFYDDSDKKGEAFRRAEGAQPGSVRVGDRWYQVSGFQPAGTLLTLGATLHRDMHRNLKDEENRPFAVTKGAANVLTDLPQLKTAKQLSDITSDPKQAGRTAASIVGSYVPGLAADIANTTDKYERDTRMQKVKGIKQIPAQMGAEALSRIPFARYALPRKKDITGQDVETAPLKIIDPTNSRPAKATSRRPASRPLLPPPQARKKGFGDL